MRTRPVSAGKTADVVHRLRCLVSTLVVVGLCIVGTASAADAHERRFIRAGMKEAEVVRRIGLPDHETIIREQGGEPQEKAWAYFPDPRDPQSLTIITFKAGVVSSVERRISR